MLDNKCPVCGSNDFKEGSLGLRAKTWNIGNKCFEITYYYGICDKCNEEVIFRSPITVRGALGTTLSNSDLILAKEDFIKNNNIVKCSFHYFLTGYMEGEDYEEEE